MAEKKKTARKALAVSLGMRLWLMAAAVLLLMLPLAPLRALLPAIDLRAEQEKRHAQA